MNFIELKVEDFIDEVLDSENEDNTNQIKLLRKFAAFIGRETEVYSVGDLSEEVILDYLRTLRNPPERRTAVDALTGFFAFLQGKGSMPNPPRINAEAVLTPRKPIKGMTGNAFFEGDDDSDGSPRHRHRWDSD